ncbi:MAG: hypothetical protein SF052_25495 [Bacteroidia bacterium]|nr:hypothetical protein [Bacteroidia bacterium]
MNGVLLQLTASFSAVFFMGSIAFSQTEEQPGADHTIYQIYVGTMTSLEDLNQFEDLKEFGFIRPFSIAELPVQQSRAEEGKKVFVGPYLGKQTAENILSLIWARGYTNAYIEADERSLRTTKTRALVYSIQLGAFQQPDMRRYEKISNTFAYGTFLTFEDGLYKVMAGLYSPEATGYMKETVIPYLQKLGFSGFTRTVREPFQ